MPRNALLFDLDGTLVDTAPDLTATLDAVLVKHGRRPIGQETVRLLVGNGTRALVRRGFEVTGGLPAPDAFDAAVADYFAHYETHLADTSRPFPGVEAALARLRAQGCVLGVCTNKPEGFSRSLLGALGLAPYFAAIVGGDSLAVRKPDGGHLLGTLARMGAQAGAAAAMIGDSENDIAGARAAGLPVIAVSFGYTAIPAAELGADALIHHFDELDGALARLP